MKYMGSNNRYLYVFMFYIQNGQLEELIITKEFYCQLSRDSELSRETNCMYRHYNTLIPQILKIDVFSGATEMKYHFNAHTLTVRVALAIVKVPDPELRELGSRLKQCSKL